MRGPGEQCEGVAVGLSVPGNTWIPQQSSCLRRPSLAQRKSNYLILWDNTHPTLPLNPAPSTLHLFKIFFPFYVVCSVICFLCVLCFPFILSFPPSYILTPAEEEQHTQSQGVSETGCRVQPYHVLSQNQESTRK